MALNTLILLAFIGGLSGWSLFVFTIINFIISRRKELELIKNIKEDVELVKSEIKKLK
jgi:hypothetical protein